jgi:hypothetical protein
MDRRSVAATVLTESDPLHTVCRQTETKVNRRNPIPTCDAISDA